MEKLHWGCRKNAFFDFLQIDVGSMFFGFSAQNDAEWWSSCRNWIDFDIFFMCLLSRLLEKTGTKDVGGKFVRACVSLSSLSFGGYRVLIIEVNIGIGIEIDVDMHIDIGIYCAK